MPFFYEDETCNQTKNGLRQQQTTTTFDEDGDENRIQTQVQSSNAEHVIDHQIQSSDENQVANDPIDNELRLGKQSTWMIDYGSGEMTCMMMTKLLTLLYLQIMILLHFKKLSKIQSDNKPWMRRLGLQRKTIVGSLQNKAKER